MGYPRKVMVYSAKGSKRGWAVNGKGLSVSTILISRQCKGLTKEGERTLERIKLYVGYISKLCCARKFIKKALEVFKGDKWISPIYTTQPHFWNALFEL